MTTMTEIRASLAALEELMGEKGVSAPQAEYTIRPSGREYIYVSGGGKMPPFDGKSSKFIYGEKEAEAMDAAFAYIRGLPDPEQVAKHEWQRKLGDVIDEGHTLNLPDEVMQPLRAGSQAMTENLLAGPK